MRKTLKAIALLTAGGFVGVAVARELAAPADQRTWHGSVAGVPYDFRPPTPDTLRAKLWAPDDPEIVKPHVFGMGWVLNVGRLVRLVQEARGRP